MVLPEGRPGRASEAFFGRRRGKAIRPAQAAALERGLARYGIDLAVPCPGDPCSLFEADVSTVRLEIGFGGGEHLLHEAATHPQTGFIGVEPFVNGMAKTMAALAHAPLGNLRVYDDDATRLLDWLPPASLDGVDLFYPDPWPKKKHWKRRFVGPANLDRFARALKPGAKFRFASDIGSYVDWTLLACRRHSAFAWQAAGASDWNEPYPGWPGTRYEAKALREGRRPAYLTFLRLWAHSAGCGNAIGLAASNAVLQAGRDAMAHRVRILEAEYVTHNVRRFRIERPDGYVFVPGQATDVSIDQDAWREEKRPFTFTGLRQWPDLEFTIKIYSDHDGVTNRLGTLQKGDSLLIEDPWGTIEYKGRGTFIAGGAGITPFIAILRDLADRGEIDGNRLIFANHTDGDIILRQAWEKMEGLDSLFVVTGEKASPFPAGPVDKAFLQSHVDDFSQHFYVCGPDKMVADINAALRELGADPTNVVFER